MTKKVALVTGASGGIGGACARELARAGYTVLAHAHHGEQAVRALCASLCAQGYDAHPCVADLSDAQDAQALCASLLAVYHHVDALVYCAGIAHAGLLQDMAVAEWDRLMAVNVRGAFCLCKALVPGMVSRQSGGIVLVSSMWGRVGASYEAAYSASKAALIGLTRALAKELGPSGVRVNCVAPGVIDTAMMDAYDQQTKDALAQETPLGRLGTGADVAGACRYLLSDAASFVTGQVLGVDGGYL